MTSPDQPAGQPAGQPGETPADPAPRRRLTLEELADVLAGEAPSDDLRQLAESPEDRQALDDLRAVLLDVDGPLATDLGSWPEPEPPVDLDERLRHAVDDEQAARAERQQAAAEPPLAPVLHRRDVLPQQGGNKRFFAVWAGGLAVLVGLVVGGLVVASNHRGHSSADAASDSAAGSGGVAGAGPATYPVSHTGRDYTAASVRAAVPGLLRSSSPAPAAEPTSDPALAALSSSGPLGSCLSGLVDTSGEQPLALDYASYGGKPALVVLLPDKDKPASVDTWVVAPTCTAQDTHFLFYARVDR